jgi:hypothetical protein
METVLAMLPKSTRHRKSLDISALKILRLLVVTAILDAGHLSPLKLELTQSHHQHTTHTSRMLGTLRKAPVVSTRTQAPAVSLAVHIVLPSKSAAALEHPACKRSLLMYSIFMKYNWPYRPCNMCVHRCAIQ